MISTASFNRIAVILLMIVTLSGYANAELIDRGGGLIYDTLFDVTWLQDANHVSTTGYDTSLYGSNYWGQLTWQDAQDWATSLSYYDSVRNVTWNDWRLPKMLPINSLTYDLAWNYDGTSDRGFNILSPNSELSHLYYVTLGNLGAISTEGVQPQPGWGLQKTGPFQNIKTSYWSGSEFVASEDIGYFSMSNGEQLTENITLYAAYKYAWAVRDGDVAAVPEPSTIFMLLPGLLYVFSRRKV
ncbi:MAG: PEP-CTERM sorting domain-containing protein [Thermodesulfobacteriota bacterium]|nr:PEP-CTERM sorting domain-containing protein [Thermodesulfobacteriota bacterium]